MSNSKPGFFRSGTAVLAASALLAAQVGHAGYFPQPTIPHFQPMQPNLNYNYASGPESYDFEGHLINGGVLKFHSPLYSASSLYNPHDTEYVDINYGSGIFSGKSEQKRFPSDFDSLIAVVTKTDYSHPIGRGSDYEPTTRYKIDTLRYAAIVKGPKWIFPSVKGRLSLFTSVPGSDDYAYSSFEGDSISRYNVDRVRKELYKNPESAKLLNHAMVGYGLTGIMLAGGVILTLIGLADSDKEATDEYGMTEHDFNASPLLFVGAGLLLTSWIPYVTVKGNFVKAVYRYNL